MQTLVKSHDQHALASSLVMEVVHENAVSLEERERLSCSVIWRLQRNYFEHQGIEAWSSGTVPHHITSSAFIADAYANVVFGFLRDCVRKHDPRQPIYIVELGSGSGRFAYLFLKRLLAKQNGSVLKDIPVKYVMTDFTQQNLEYLRKHAHFQRFIDEGLLDFARFDVEHDQQLKLINSGETISARNLINPLIVIANYLFDSIPQDSFFVSAGQLFETLVSLTTQQEEEDLDDPEILSRIKVTYEFNRVNGNYYKDKSWNRILLDYKQRFSETAFLFPTATLNCIKNLHQLSSGHMLLLSGDRGYSTDEALREGRGVPGMAMHGSFSMMVDYQLIGEYCRDLGARVLSPQRPTDHLNVSAFMFGDLACDFIETRQAYAEAIEKFGPDDFFTLKEGVAQLYDALALDEVLAFLRLSCWDYKRFRECLPVLKKHLPDATDLQKQQLHEVILKVWDSYLPIGEESDLAFDLGTLLLEIEFNEEALEFLQRSVDLYGIAPGTAYNLAVCYYSLGHMDQALDYVNQALGLDHKFTEAKTLRRLLKSALSRTARRLK